MNKLIRKAAVSAMASHIVDCNVNCASAMVLDGEASSITNFDAFGIDVDTFKTIVLDMYDEIITEVKSTQSEIEIK